MKEVQYQARSADEAQRTVYMCFSCPLDASRLSTDTTGSSSTPSSIWSTPRKKRRSQDRPSVRGAYVRTHYVACFPVLDVDFDESIATVMQSARVSLSGARGSMPGAAYRLPHPAEVLCDNPYGIRCATQREAPSPGLWGHVEEFDEYTELSSTGTPEPYAVGCFLPGPEVAGAPSFLVKHAGRDCVLLCRRVADLDEDYWDTVACVHALGHRPRSARQLLDPVTLARLSNLSPRAWDAPEPTVPAYIYTTKVDGQRAWVLLCGRMCYYVARLGSREIFGWWLCEGKAGRRGMPVVLDVEFMACGPSVLIDVLVDIHGCSAPVSRSMRWVIDCWRELILSVPDIPVCVRQYFCTMDQAAEHARSHGTVYDGVIGIPVNSTEAIKIKEVRSVELEVKGEYLVCAEGTPVLRSSSSGRFSEGTVVEVRFSFPRNSKVLRVHDMFERTDKTVANDALVCRSIFTCALQGVNAPGDIQRREAVTWCRELRASILQRAWSVTGTGNIVLDFGTGDGQSVDSLSTLQKGAYVLVEPDAEKCKKLSRRLGHVRVHVDPMSLIPVVSHLHKGSKEYVIANMRASDVLGCEDLMHHLKRRVRCAVATFSAQFCLDDVDTCSSYSIPFIGCCYLYDGVPVGEHVINLAGVSMLRTSAAQALIKWGGDNTYKEPALTTSDFNGVCRVTKGSAIQKLPDPIANKDANSICSRVYVVTGV